MIPGSCPRGTRVPRGWSEPEVERLVADYLEMLRLELSGVSYSKAAHRRRLRAALDGRTEASVERKHQNVSAVLIESGVPCIPGYKPLGNYQRSLLPRVVGRLLDRDEELRSLLLRTADSGAEPSLFPPSDVVEESPPEPESGPGTVREAGVHPRRGVDYLLQEARNRSLGASGELLALQLERRRLEEAGRGGLAERVEQVSETVGDGIGYDIHSYEDDGTDRFIEVKTTRYGKYTPFYITRREVDFSAGEAARYRLFRLFDFQVAPRLYVLRGDISRAYGMDPAVYRVSPSRRSRAALG